MKTKLMFAALAAAAVFTACNKENPVQTPEMGNKSIVLNIANVVPGTKTPGTSIADETQVTLNDYQIFFVDNSGNFYSPKDATASTAVVPTFFEVTEASTLSHQFHFLDNNVSRVIVVGNKGADFAPDNEAALWAALSNVAVGSQQDENALILYGSDSSLTVTADHAASEDQHPSPVYKAVVNLKPAVARFEVVGYEYAQVQQTVEGVTTLLPREYASIAINNQSLIGFYGAASFTSTGEADWTVTPGAVTKPVVIYTWDNVYQDYFSELTDADKAAWYYDATEYTLTGTTQDATTWAAAAEWETETAEGDCYAYHVYPTAVPSFIFQLTGTDANGIVTPLYIQTKSFTGIPETGIQAGNVYQMTAKFDDTNLKAAEKCIDVEITVHEWVVTVVTPEF